jgi:hypothetical protein
MFTLPGEESSSFWFVKVLSLRSTQKAEMQGAQPLASGSEVSPELSLPTVRLAGGQL